MRSSGTLVLDGVDHLVLGASTAAKSMRLQVEFNIDIQCPSVRPVWT